MPEGRVDPSMLSVLVYPQGSILQGRTIKLLPPSHIHFGTLFNNPKAELSTLPWADLNHHLIGSPDSESKILITGAPLVKIKKYKLRKSHENEI